MLRSCEEHTDCIIVHETFHCPVCEDIKEIKADAEAEAERLQTIIDKLNE